MAEGISTHFTRRKSNALATSAGSGGKSHRPYEFGVKASIATTLNRCKGGQFAIHAKTLPRRPYDGHTLETVLPDIEALTGAGISRVLADAGYKGHNAPLAHKFHVFTTSTSSQPARSAASPRRSNAR